MGTLLNQRPRNYHDVEFDRHVISDCEEIQKIAKKTKMSVADVIEVYKISTKNRLINCYVDNGNIFDEQMAGFGELFQALNEKQDVIVDYLQSRIEEG